MLQQCAYVRVHIVNIYVIAYEDRWVQQKGRHINYIALNGTFTFILMLTLQNSTPSIHNQTP